ncbi:MULTISPECIES: lysophospholipid acyltransferase family protein [unclassified Sphingomonas]|uniref:lysophospholipid acyltransferase family protein n=1 Tax=unclassified Sphingomonas TaxID=196159 RepID=UPI0006F29D2B|nr:MULTISPECIES: lysophospholipid acyltransferase family protein [unclassified Sphingomonas]KQX20827.1 acyl-phosphate glycerol 3-phosphate acyltransferase [Sphingomonas sp. Root1294]KQY68673.1 acyl-phosphate glycerol 3-phosphate acyltransferase [Sphingomonas sp. Root50]KRB88078.1 acyl-phosphate glycerol 3-phosphate acyltransferase [Sphingomonas sp. Root720]
MKRYRTIGRTAVALFVLFFCLTGYVLTWPVRKRIGWPRFFLQWFGEAMGLEVRVEGRPLGRDVLYVANHVSWLDILALGGATPTWFISKDDVGGWPLVGMLARIGGTIFIDRNSRRAAHGQVDQLGQALLGHYPITLFPEGTTGDGRSLFPFRPALFASVAPPPPGISVQPVAIDYDAAASEICWTGDEDLGPNARKVLGRPGRLRCTIRFLPPLEPSDDRKALAARAQSAIAAALRLP